MIGVNGTRGKEQTMISHTTNPVRRLAKTVVVGLLAALALAFTAAPAVAASPVWELHSENFPNRLVPDRNALYVVSPINVGDGSTTADAVTLVIDLPDHVQTAFAPGFFGMFLPIASGAGWDCGVVAPGQDSVTCVTTTPIVPGAESPAVSVHVAVENGAAGDVEAQIEVSGGGAGSAQITDPATISAAPGGFGIDPTTFFAKARKRDGFWETDMGARPYSASIGFTFNTSTSMHGFVNHIRPIDSARQVDVELPPGFVGNPRAMPKCPASLMDASVNDQGTSLGAALCPPSTQVGVATLTYAAPVISPDLTMMTPYRVTYPIYNLTPDQDQPALFGFNVNGNVITLHASLRSNGDYGITVRAPQINQGLATISTLVTLWGVPADSSHDYQRHRTGSLTPGDGSPTEPLSANVPARPFLTNPTACGLTATTWVRATSWQNLAAGLGDPIEDVAPPATGCEKLVFNPQMRFQPTTDMPNSPTGATVELNVPFNDSPAGIATPALKKAKVTLPEGMTVSPSAADGLVGCTDQQVGLGSAGLAACPPASRIGNATVETPLLEDAMSGGVFLGSQESSDPASGRMFRLFLVLNGPGVRVKLEGQVRPNASTGRVEATFDNNPQLPFEKLTVRFKDGPRAPLVTPGACGANTVSAELTPWGGPVANPTDSFEIDCGSGQGFDPSFEAGTENPRAGASSPFALRFGRGDNQPEISAIGVEMPRGLLANLNGVQQCESQAADRGVCPAGSRIGHTQIAAGVGSSPLWVPQVGKDPTAVYLSGPYRGAPFSLSILVPAQAGPFDLGKVVVRTPIQVDARTAQITVPVAESRIYNPDGSLDQVIAGALPRILKGVPLRLKEARVIVDRERFMLNPTNCTRQQVNAQIDSVDGGSADVSSRFQVGDCAALGFAPRFSARILDKGRRSTLRSFNPRMRFTVSPRPGQANIGRAAVTLPHAVILDQSNIRTVCTRARFAARNCPERSVYGHAKAWSPVLNRPVEGPVYLGSSPNKLPDLIADLEGEVRIVLQGRIDTATGGRIRNTFETVPDAPVSRFELTMFGGKNRGILVNSTDLCRSTERGVASFTGQNGKRNMSRPHIGLTFKGCAKVRRKAARKQAQRKAARRAAHNSARRAARN